MGRRSLSFSNLSLIIALGLATPALALEKLSLKAIGSNTADLQEQLNAASVLRAAQRDNVSAPQDLLAAAMADYTRLLETLYASGYYSGTVSILLDGQEAALIPPLETPPEVNTIAVTVSPGKPFRFGETQLAPLAPGGRLPSGFRRGARARATVVQEATADAVTDWRAVGHAKADVAGQKITINHATDTLNANIRLSPGPRLRFGKLNVDPGSAVSDLRIRKIAGLPAGETFSPDEVDRAATRLRRSGVFRSVSLTEAKTANPDGSLDIAASVIDEKPRRIGAGAALSTHDGLRLSGFWLHRNLLGGAERFRVEGEVSGLGGSTAGIDYRLGARIDRPAQFGPDTGVWLKGELEHLDEPDYRTDRFSIGFGAHRQYSDQLTADLGIVYETERTVDAFGDRNMRLLTIPGTVAWDNRDNQLNPKRGTYVRLDGTPFIALAGADNGLRAKLDARAYHPLGSSENVVLAGRAQIGSVIGAGIARTPPRYLFHSGGGGTVRGQPYNSLGVDLGANKSSGGRSFVGLSGEVRTKIRGKFSAVGFVDAGYVGRESFYDGTGAWHAGAGLGVRYDTVVGPIRFDVAAPVYGDAGDGIQIYIGIGQAF